jgi:hypothetical protein
MSEFADHAERRIRPLANWRTSLNNFYVARIRITLYFFSVLIFAKGTRRRRGWYFSIKGKVRIKIILYLLFISDYFVKDKCQIFG